MKNLLSKLVQILKIDTEIDELIEFKNSIPSAIEFLREESASIQTELTSKSQNLATYESEKNQKESSLADNNEWLIKREERVKDLKNNKEFHAAQKEITQSKKTIVILEEDITRLTAQIDEIKPVIAELEQNLSTQITDIESKIAEKQGESQKFDQLITEKTALRGNEETLVSPEILKKYKSIKNKITPAMALADNGTCMECSTRIPPQMYIEIQKMDSLVTCQRCHRILYIHEVL